ncbi:deoxyuridine 5'-triphosphate nucleotidohydrolase Dut [Thermoclostridium stercorarium subsp. stercorarium DSM 8532]|uniref:dUTP diphosphatase n=3 Tax=Thermoclostridium stercorarium TaxID=1510 RepID=L7VST0_THES1|nr:deoxyuridine 5'-triphosphate nucleotidohydrolase Dut [Thermoclostridium stercorarium]AGC69634.1 deoxyuridine 5'-triphosphate nucleotidohydrolase Dut [Thermoclostridium stercorarium subsp. stercorarium DSM 8532]AGI40586.1 deoxyuridine 5-triphosphate nucleotidohydrolase [Thermoclostridium stercorarium subsp. stercorarium DSM 8532]ANW99858.1 aminotransferase [Thermoclostridium stercorarium subsp. thermolacticum DSM 2910]ANX02482.1 aminotransferase [Thermoclostridium stercorarium subsp. leptospa
MKEIEVAVEICREGAKLPEYQNEWDSGMDVCAAEDVIIRPNETVIVPTGLKLAIPPGYEIQVRPRSGITLRTPLRISNSPGTIDAGYRDEVGIIITNTSAETGDSTEYYTVDSLGNKQGIYLIRKGDRIAQLVLQEVPRMRLKVVDSVAGIGTNRGGGFGSTGVNEREAKI